MKATELRIGNLVLLDTGQTLPYPHAIMPSDLDLIHNDNLPKYASIEPIPLTEEWLLKFGFNQSGSTFTENDTFNLKLNRRSELIVYCSKDIYCEIGTYQGTTFGRINYMKHVNQLQNLYFALTGEELTLKQ